LIFSLYFGYDFVCHPLDVKLLQLQERLRHSNERDNPFTGR
jgi:hypothetical protein